MARQESATSLSGEKSFKHVCEANIILIASRHETKSAFDQTFQKFDGELNKQGQSVLDQLKAVTLTRV